MTFNTGNPVGSTDARDLYDNAQNFDKLSVGTEHSYPDRLGVSRKSWAGLEADFNAFLAASGFEPDVLQYVDGSPLTVLRPTQLIERASTPGILYAIKLPSAFPVNLSGDWAVDEPSLVIRVDSSLRNDLDSSTGAEMVGYGAATVAAALDDLAPLAEVVPELQRVASEYVRPQDFGAVGDGVADDTTAVLDTLADGRPIYWGDDSKTYRVTAMLSTTLSRSMVWSSNGARIVMDSPSAVQRVFNITAAGNHCYSLGRLVVDCNLKSYSGVYISNNGAFADCRLTDLNVRNAYRSGTAFTGGDGIWIRGAFTNVYLERPDVRNVRMATGAGVLGAQGISGITISSAGAGRAPQEVTIVHPFIDGVLSEDTGYAVDQDGIRIFTEEDIVGESATFETHFTILGGKIRNSRGRAIKLQTEFGNIIGTMIIRDGSLEPLVAGAGIMPEIDFQVGGGQIKNIELKYRSAAPARVIQFSGTRQAGKLVAGGSCDGVRISLSGGTDLARFAEISMFESSSASYTFKDIFYSGTRNFGSHFLQISTPIEGRTCFVSLENIQARITSSFRYVNKSAATGTVIAVGRNLYNASNSTSFSVSAGGTITTLLEGINTGVVV